LQANTGGAIPVLRGADANPQKREAYRCYHHGSTVILKVDFKSRENI
jgi:hypothetical protein